MAPYIPLVDDTLFSLTLRAPHIVQSQFTFVCYASSYVSISMQAKNTGGARNGRTDCNTWANRSMKSTRTEAIQANREETEAKNAVEKWVKLHGKRKLKWEEKGEGEEVNENYYIRMGERKNCQQNRNLQSKEKCAKRDENKVIGFILSWLLAVLGSLSAWRALFFACYDAENPRCNGTPSGPNGSRIVIWELFLSSLSMLCVRVCSIDAELLFMHLEHPKVIYRIFGASNAWR